MNTKAYRNNKIRQAAKGQECTWPGCRVQDDTVVFAHSNMSLHGKSIGRKADDLFGAFLCYKHHNEYDNLLTRTEAIGPFMLAMSKTQKRLIDMGIIK